MPDRSTIATEELARLLSTLSHRHRILIIEELRHEEKDVSSLSALLEISASRVSQHLGLLKSHHIVKERRCGRHVYYHLVEPEIAQWLATGLRFVESEISDISKVHDAVEHTRAAWLES